VSGKLGAETTPKKGHAKEQIIGVLRQVEAKGTGCRWTPTWEHLAANSGHSLDRTPLRFRNSACTYRLRFRNQVKLLIASQTGRICSGPTAGGSG
jgi:hypothetical protein